METKNAQTVARQAATPTAPQGGASSEAPASAQTGKEGRRADEITLRVPNPLIERQKAPPPQSAPPQVDPMSPHSQPTAKLKVSSLVWNEYNSMPLTPPPASLGRPQTPLSNPGSLEPAKKRRGLILVLVAGIIGAGAIVGALLPRNKTGSPVDSRPEQESKNPTGTPEKSLDLPKSPGPGAAASPAPSPPAKRHVSVTVEPAEATLALDGTVAAGHVIALDLVQDGKPHLVQATARGYLPFKKSFTLEGDVNLHISLRKAASPAPAFSHPKTLPSEPVAKPPEMEPSVKPKAEPVEDFGMDLNRPALRRQTKMDEKDPYSP